uniref:Uncharacterized protein n=1 Tax=Rhizophora mucronata TaxID=61149 RepID=A0A2P2NHT4_RHIMU
MCILVVKGPLHSIFFVVLFYKPIENGFNFRVTRHQKRTVHHPIPNKGTINMLVVRIIEYQIPTTH